LEVEIVVHQKMIHYVDSAVGVDFFEVGRMCHIVINDTIS